MSNVHCFLRGFPHLMGKHRVKCKILRPCLLQWDSTWIVSCIPFMSHFNVQVGERATGYGVSLLNSLFGTASKAALLQVNVQTSANHFQTPLSTNSHTQANTCISWNRRQVLAGTMVLLMGRIEDLVKARPRKQESSETFFPQRKRDVLVSWFLTILVLALLCSFNDINPVISMWPWPGCIFEIVTDFLWFFDIYDRAAFEFSSWLIDWLIDNCWSSNAPSLREKKMVWDLCPNFLDFLPSLATHCPLPTGYFPVHTSTEPNTTRAVSFITEKQLWKSVQWHWCDMWL